MAEEIRFFLRIGLFSLIAGTVYWLLSYEWAGTFLFGFVVLGTGFFVAAVAFLLKGTRTETDPGGSERKNRMVGALDRTLGFAEDADAATGAPLSVQEELIPPASIWPFGASVAALLVGLGLLYGAWFWLPGAVLGVLSAYGWVTELTR